MKKIIKKFEKYIETIKIKIRRKYIIITARIRNKLITNKDFTIISNNCWGGFVYQSYGLKYTTPTIGMFLVAEDYIKFISNLEYYLSIEKFKLVKPEQSKWYEQLKNISKYGEYPIARIGDIELHLLHYHSIGEAQDKWNERKKRINYQNILFKFSEMNLCTKKDIEQFQALKFKNKICFISKKNSDLKNNYTYIVSNSKKKQLKASEEPVGNSYKVNINSIINKIKKES